MITAFLLIITPYHNYGMEEESSTAKKIGLIALIGAAIGGGYLAYKKYIQGGQSDAFLNAAKENDCSTITKLLDDGIDVNVIDSDGRTALIFAAQKGHIEAVQCLLDNPHIKVDQQDSFGSTALMFAAQENHCPVINILLEHGADINKGNTKGTTALRFAVAEGHMEAVKCLLSNPQIKIDQVGTDGGTALSLAVFYNNCPMITILLEHGADINKIVLESGIPVLALAVAQGHMEAVKCLLSNPRIKIDQPSNGGLTALMHAAQDNNCPMITILLEYGADVNKDTPMYGDTALLFAVDEGHMEAVKCLLNNPYIAIDQQNKKGTTALSAAINTKNKLMIKELLDAGADPEFVNKFGVTPRNNAIKIIYPEGYAAAIQSAATRFPQPSITSDAEILSLINKAIIRKHGGVNPFIETQK